MPRPHGARDEPPRPRAVVRAHVPARPTAAARAGGERTRRRRPASRRSRCSWRAPALAIQASSSRQTSLRPSQRSAAGWTGCRSRSSWSPLAPACCRRPRSSRAGRTPSGSTRAERTTCRLGSRRSDRRSTGATTCSSREEQALLRRLAAFSGGFGLARGRGGVRGGRRRAACARPPADHRARRAGRPESRRARRRFDERAALPAARDRSRLPPGAARGRGRAGRGRSPDGRRRRGPSHGAPVSSVSPATRLDELERELNNFHAALDIFLRTRTSRAVELATDLFGLWRTRRVRERAVSGSSARSTPPETS